MASSSSDCVVLFAEPTDLVSNDMPADVAGLPAADDAEQTVPDIADKVRDTEGPTLETMEAEEVSLVVAKEIVEAVTAVLVFSREMAMGAAELVGAASLAEEDKSDVVLGNAILVALVADVVVAAKLGTRMMSGPRSEEERCAAAPGAA